MSQNFLNRIPTATRQVPMRARMAIALPLWVFLSFILAQVIIVATIYALSVFGVNVRSLNESMFNAVIAAIVYVLTLAIVVGLPWLVKKRPTTRLDIGLAGLPTWRDMGLAPLGFVVYILLSGIIAYALTQLIPSFDASQVQDVGFTNLSQRYEYFLAFMTLVVIAPVAEEVLFRGYLFGKLRKSIPLWAAILLTSLLFGAVHGQWNVGIDVFVLSVVACILRVITGSIWAGILLHMIKNGLAFYILFINTSFLIQ